MPSSIASWNGLNHPAADRYPMMLRDRLEELAHDIADNGQREPIWVDVDGNLIDGRNRLQACGIAGIEPTFAIYEGDDIEAFIISKNEHRRDLAPAERARIRQRRVQELARQGMSARAIAAEVGVSHTTVEKDMQVATELPPDPDEDSAALIAAMEEAREPAPERVTGRDGKSYPAKKKKPETNVDKSRDATAARWERVAELAATSRTSAQIATEVGLSEEGLRAGCKQRGIVIASDAVMRKKRRTSSTDIVDRIVANSGVSQSTIDLIDFTALDPDPEVLQRWIDALQGSIRSLTTIKKALEGLR